MPTGGYNTVRGYRENLPMRDNAVVASIEYQFPLLDVDGSTADFDARRLKLAVFADHG
jgi:outer membrane protein assembly factor BamA